MGDNHSSHEIRAWMSHDVPWRILSRSEIVFEVACDLPALTAKLGRVEHARPGVSSRYTFVSTAQVVALLGAEGWEPVKASEQRVRLEGRIGFQMHEIRFTRRADLEAGTFDVGSTRAEMVLQNAHDGSPAYRIDAGLHPLVCRNGLTVADADLAHVSIWHVDIPPRHSRTPRSPWLRTPLPFFRRVTTRVSGSCALLQCAARTLHSLTPASVG